MKTWSLKACLAALREAVHRRIGRPGTTSGAEQFKMVQT
ncbi:hypothetical protein T261_8016 [Streptomyces lydicus]|nr:hypothetical protein T261_8016 [Streptomyces lydicus]